MRIKFQRLRLPGLGLIVALSLVSGAIRGQQPEQVPAPRPLDQTQGRPETTVLTLVDLEQIALENNPTLIQASAQIQVSRGKALQGGLRQNPIVGYEGDEIGAGGKAGQQGIFLEQQILTGGKRFYERSKFEREATVGNWQAMAQQQRVVNGVRTRFYEALAQQELVAVEDALKRIADETVTTTDELMNVGQANRPDLLQARVEARRRRIALENARNRYEAAWGALAAVAGIPSLQATPLEGNLERETEAVDPESAWRRILDTSPEIQAARAKVARQQMALRREQVERIPDIHLRASVQHNYETDGEQAGAEIGLRLPIFNGNQGNIRAAEAEITRAQAEIARVELSLQQRFARVLADYRTSLRIVEEYRQHVLPESREAYELYLASFRQRRAAWPQVLGAQRDYFQASVEYVEGLLDLRRSEVAIDGLLLVDGLNEPSNPSDEGREGPSSSRMHNGENLRNPLNGGR